MKFGEIFSEYLRTRQGLFMDKWSNVEYKRLKKVLKRCRCRSVSGQCRGDEGEEGELSQCYEYESCPLCDQMFFSELTKEASDIAGCFSTTVRRLIQLHVHGGIQRYVALIRCCFPSPQQATAQECRLLIEYVMMNAVAMRKILKKYDKVHKSVNGMKFKSKMRSEHLEILHMPWLIELGAFYMNFKESNGGDMNGDIDGLLNPFAFSLNAADPMMTLILPDSTKLEYRLTCPICLELAFNPYALSCGHLYCKGCICTAASVMIFEGLKAASPRSKCPVCREVDVYAKSVHMLELDMLVKKECKEYWKERLGAERAETVKQSKLYWNMQAQNMVGY